MKSGQDRKERERGRQKGKRKKMEKMEKRRGRRWRNLCERECDRMREGERVKFSRRVEESACERSFRARERGEDE